MVNTGNEYMANISLICYYRARYFYVFHILQVFFSSNGGKFEKIDEEHI